MDKFFDVINNTIINEMVIRNTIYSIVLVLGIWLIRLLLKRAIINRIELIQLRYTVRKISTSAITFFMLFVLGLIWINDFSQIGTFLGIVAAGFAIILKDILINISAWIVILVKKPFSIGDRIQIEESSGDIIDVNILFFSILEIGNWVDADQSTGRIIHIPNSKIFTEKLANYTKAFEYIWNEIRVLITFESDWQKAKEILKEIAFLNNSSISDDVKKQLLSASKQYMILYSNISPIVYTSVKDSGVQLSIRYLCKARNRRSSENEIWEDILVKFEKNNNINLAYPTQRFYSQNKEKE